MMVLQQINSLIQQGQIPQAEKLCRDLVRNQPALADGWQTLGRICQVRADFDGMLMCAEKVIALRPSHAIAKLQQAEALLNLCRIEDAKIKLRALEKIASKEPMLWPHIAQFYTQLGAFERAYHCYHKTRSSLGDTPEVLYNCAAAAIAVGRHKEAEQLLDQVIEKNPHDYDAYYNRATLKKQTADSNNIDQMRTLLTAGPKNRNGEVQLGYALAKEYEDLGQNQKSFEALKKGADSRRAGLSYDVSGDVETMAEIAHVMSGDFFSDLPEQSAEAGPVFILGMPRSGTTLVDRILSSHSDINSLGEINDLALAMMKHAPKAASKLELIRNTAQIDFAVMGQSYLSGTCARDRSTALLIDKTPANFLYIGLIARALPNAKIIHLRRGAMDSCYAMYKTLFRMGYPFSYSLEDLGAYYVAYHKLMAHWRTELPGRILDLDYEILVADQENQSQRMISFIGCDWQQDCLDFHKNTSASATASAAQVTQPIYQTSVEKWRRYENELAPLREILEAAGIEI